MIMTNNGRKGVGMIIINHCTFLHTNRSVRTGVASIYRNTQFIYETIAVVITCHFGVFQDL